MILQNLSDGRWQLDLWARNSVHAVAGVAKPCLRFRLHFCQVCNKANRIQFGFMQGLQNIPLIQGIKMQGMQNLACDSVRNYAGVAKSSPRFRLHLCQVCNEANRILFGFMQGVQWRFWCSNRHTPVGILCLRFRADFTPCAMRQTVVILFHSHAYQSVRWHLSSSLGVSSWLDRWGHLASFWKRHRPLDLL